MNDEDVTVISSTDILPTVVTDPLDFEILILVDALDIAEVVTVPVPSKVMVCSPTVNVPALEKFPAISRLEALTISKSAPELMVKSPLTSISVSASTSPLVLLIVRW